MRKKIEELRNREEGFTLVELLAVIVILGIIVAIAIPAVGNVIDRADKNATEAEDALVVDAARLYVTTNREDKNFPKEIEVKTLIDEGYLDNRDNKTFAETDKVTVTKEENVYKYSFRSYTSEEDVNKEGE